MDRRTAPERGSRDIADAWKAAASLPRIVRIEVPSGRETPASAPATVPVGRDAAARSHATPEFRRAQEPRGRRGPAGAGSTDDAEGLAWRDVGNDILHPRNRAIPRSDFEKQASRRVRRPVTHGDPRKPPLGRRCRSQERSRRRKGAVQAGMVAVSFQPGFAHSSRAAFKEAETGFLRLLLQPLARIPTCCAHSRGLPSLGQSDFPSSTS